ncbi:MAG TPA: HAMP domain-containing sensor histidine kinase, partial [Actinomycetes bacterium]|nr:HAMP domain-containing sensor histidine kinase [Actinomycetes bacterium]
MTGRPRWSAINGYVVAVTVTGSAILLVLAFRGGARSLSHMPAIFWLLWLFMVVGEIRYIVLPRSGDLESITTTTCLGLAMLLGWGPAPTALGLAASSIVSDCFHRKAPRKVVFNAAQYAIAMAAGGSALLMLGVRPPFEAAQLPAFLAAAVVYLLVNKTLVGIVVAMHQRAPIDLRLWRGSGVEILPKAIMVAMAPLVLVVAERSIWLALLLPLPMIGVHLACKAAIDAEANRAAAEAAVAAARVVADEQARLAQAEQAVARRLQESERLKENLLATVSHELRTPLAGVLGAIATLDQRGHLLTPELQGEFIAMAARQGKRLRELIEDLLLAATLEQIPSERVPAPPVDLADLARQACKTARQADPNQPVVASVDGSLPVRAAPDAVLQVLTNLLDNAVRHSPEDVPIRLEARRQGAHALIAIQDAGPGVPLAQRERVFERFIRLDDERAARRGGGVGLGLYVARRLARAQGGDLRIAEPVGEQAGARFELVL